MSVKHYRRDIDGLRAIAVAAVILFHAGVPGVGGGFVGVDVFFVISGFLITGILRRETDRGRIDIVHFYERRVRRIMPALLMFFAVTLAAGLVLLVPADLVELGKEMLASLAFVSNVKFWRGADYWATLMRPLLHTWSLSIEEQFYLFFPLLLAWLARRGPGTRRWAIVMLAALSLAVAVMWVDLAPAAAFFLLPARLWELALGAILALDLVPRLANARMRQSAAAAGLAMIIIPCLLYTERTPFPGLAALIPCLGTALVIQAGREGQTAVGALLSRPLLVGLGLISYSLYLYHYPALLFAREIAGDERLPFPWMAGAILVSLLLAAASWRWIEQPFRDSRRVGRRALFIAAATASALVTAAASWVVLADGLPGRLTAAQHHILAAGDDLDPCFMALGDAPARGAADPQCVIGAPAAPASFAIIGDSHAAVIASAIAPLAREQGRRGRLVAAAACPPLLGFPMTHLDGQARRDCADRMEREIAAIARDPAIDTVILTAWWPAYVREYGEDADRLIAPALLATATALRGKKLILLYDLPQAPINLPRQLVVADRFGRPTPTLRLGGPAGFTPALPALRRQGVRLVSLAPPVCPTRRDCPALVGGRPVLKDTNHITRTIATELYTPYFRRLRLLD